MGTAAQPIPILLARQRAHPLDLRPLGHADNCLKNYFVFRPGYARDLRFSSGAIQQGNVGLLGTQNGQHVLPCGRATKATQAKRRRIPGSRRQTPAPPRPLQIPNAAPTLYRAGSSPRLNLRVGVGLNSDLGCSATLMGAVPDRARNVLFSPYTEAVRERLRMVYKRIEHPKRPDIDALLIKCVKTTRPESLTTTFSNLLFGLVFATDTQAGRRS